MIKIKDKEFTFEQKSLKDILKENPSLAGNNLVFAAYRAGETVELNYIPKDGDSISLIDFSSEEGRNIYWHSSSHILAMAVLRLFPNVRLAIGPAIENGFYYDFFFDPKDGIKLAEEDLAKIEEEMKKIIDENVPFERFECPKSDILPKYSKNKFKTEILKNDIADDIVSYYKNGEDFFDMCRGPHVPSTGYIKSLKLTSIAGAYWRGNENNEMLTRIYGISFPDRKMLKEYITKLEEAKKRDHRLLGKKLGIFSIFEETGAGLVYWHPAGGTIRDIIERFWKDEHIKRGYELVLTPHIARAELWKTSGHYDFYKENMYIFTIDEEEYVLKPMNCPGHVMIYKTKMHSYRDLPVRFAELGTVYRYERSGTLHGLLRVRGFTQDDGHIFCTPEQLEDEIEGVFDFAVFIIESFGYSKYEVELSMIDPENPDKYAGTMEEWDTAQNTLKKILEKKGVPFKEMPGEAVFYGPKIDIKLEDALGRKWQGPTVQFDFNLPRRFGVTYVGEDNKEHYVYMVHRALMGSLERFIGGLIENYAGRFPLWLSPVQVSVMTVTEETVDYAKKISKILKDEGFRISENYRNDKIGYKIRESENNQIPYMLVIGKKEKDEQVISVRKKMEGDLGSMTVDALISRLKQELDKRTTD